VETVTNNDKARGKEGGRLLSNQPNKPTEHLLCRFHQHKVELENTPLRLHLYGCVMSAKCRVRRKPSTPNAQCRITRLPVFHTKQLVAGGFVTLVVNKAP
jgi:hypothetical protein